MVMCRALRIDYSSQLAKLKGKPWAGMVKFTTPDVRGRPQESCFLHLDAVPMWLASIDPGYYGLQVRSWRGRDAA
jgi:P22_AR N-terminal domain